MESNPIRIIPVNYGKWSLIESCVYETGYPRLKRVEYPLSEEHKKHIRSVGKKRWPSIPSLNREFSLWKKDKEARNYWRRANEGSVVDKEVIIAAQERYAEAMRSFNKKLKDLSESS